MSFIESFNSPFRESFYRLFKILTKIKKYPQIFIFLLAYFFYIDGVNTIIKMATNFASSIGLGMMVMLGTIIGIQILAFPFAIWYGKLADIIGVKKMLFFGIIVYIIITFLSVMMPLVSTKNATMIFIAVAILVATSQGGIQALSRSYFATLIPDNNNSGEFFGLYNTMGKFATVLGPFLMGSMPALALKLGWENEKTSYSFAPASILVIFIIGFGLLYWSGLPLNKKKPNNLR